MNCTASLSSPQNGTISNHSVPATPGTKVTFQCDDGLFPEGIMTATCLATGGWDKIPAEIVCRNESSNLINLFALSSKLKFIRSILLQLYIPCTQFRVSCLSLHSMEHYSTPTL